MLSYLNVKNQDMTIQQLQDDGSGDYRQFLKRIKGSGGTHFILDFPSEVLEDYMKQAQQVGLITEKFHYIITDLDMHTIDLGPYQHAGSNITGVWKNIMSKISVKYQIN